MPRSQDSTLPQDLSSQLARSQIQRRLSTQSSSTSSSSKRVSARVTKLKSAENSPHNVQRRRTTAAHTTRGHPRASQDNPYLTREQRLWNYYNSRTAPVEARPFSWHPGSAPLSTPNVPLPINKINMGNTITGIENLAVSETPPSVQQSIQDAFFMGYGYPINRPLESYEQQFTASEGLYQATAPNGLDMLPSYSSYDFSEPMQDYCLGEGPSYQPQNYLINQWSQPSLPETSILDTSLNTITLPQVQQPPSSCSHLDTKDLPDIPKEEGDELVGIGLYDNEDRSYNSTLNSAVSDNPARISLGKELKLEETWQPSNDDDEDGGNSSDEPDEELPVIGPDLTETQTAFYPNYGDLSNQSFFFSDDVDTYSAESQYPNYLAFDPSLQPDQLKPQPAGSGNFLWF
ncbi:MAG: hypothetical protein Q9164_001494 [Protoblastenia rupestris]